MNIETRYNLGDTVWHLRTWNARKAITCPLCSGAGKVQIGETDRTTYCPDCNTRGRITTTEQQTSAEISRLTIGQVRAEVSGAHTVVEYMAHETGVGSGSIYYEPDFYPTREDAEQACADKGAVLVTVDRDEVTA